MFRFDVLAKNEETRKKNLAAFVATWYTDYQLVTHIPLGDDKEALIDRKDFNTAAQFYWHAHKSDHGTVKWYAEAKIPASMRTSRSHKSISLHRLLMGFPLTHVDHRDGNGLNCTRLNMRIATQSQNASNRLYKNKTGFRGVIERNGRYAAQLMHHRANRVYGWYDKVEEAALRYNGEAIKQFGDFAVLNEVQA